MKIVINTCFGGFSLSYKAMMMLYKLKSIKLYAFTYDTTTTIKKIDINKYITYDPKKHKSSYTIHYSTTPLNSESKIDNSSYISNYNVSRTDSDLIEVVEKLGKKADGEHAELKVIEIPDDIAYSIEEYDGKEHIAEKHRTWS